MPVIGRLDEQVNDILITPLEKRRERDDEPDEPPPPVTTEPEPAGETAPPRDELPVWML